jgi:hypothetical protein
MTCLVILKPTHKFILLLIQYTGSDGIILFLLNQDQTNLLEDASSMNLVYVYNSYWEMLLPPQNWEKLTSSLCPWLATSLNFQEFTYLVEIWCGLAPFLITELTSIFLHATRLQNQARGLELVSKSGSLNLAQLHFDPAPRHLDQSLHHQDPAQHHWDPLPQLIHPVQVQAGAELNMLAQYCWQEITVLIMTPTLYTPRFKTYWRWRLQAAWTHFARWFSSLIWSFFLSV